MDIKEEALLCVISRVLVYHPLSGRRLLEEAESVEMLLKSGASLVKRVIGSEEIANLLFSDSMLSWGMQEALWMRSRGVKLICIVSESYPKLLKEIPFAPFMLYYRGSAALADDTVKSLGVVGTRMATDYGRENCSAIIAGLVKHVRKLRIISGLAVGIDSCAHRAALDNSIETLCVLPCGIDSIYPSRHRELAVKILESGGVVTEYPRGTKPLKHNFLQRNRIIAGLSEAILVVESRIRGGSMSTVDFASSYNRDVFAVPGRTDDVNSYGCNYLISKNIAQLCLNPSTIVSSMRWTNEHISDIIQQPSLFSASDGLKEKILLSLSPVRGIDVNQLSLRTGQDIQTLQLLLIEMTIEGLVRHSSSGLWLKA